MNIGITLIGQMITFVLFVLFTMKFIWPPIMKALETRRKNIAEGLEAAEKSKQALADAEKVSAEKLEEARVEAQRIIEQARRQAEGMVASARSEAKSEADRIVAAARVQTKAEMRKAQEELRGQLTELTLLLAERVIQQEIDPAKHAVLLKSAAARLS